MDLNFIEDDKGLYSASFVSEGLMAVQLDRVSGAKLVVSAFIEDMKPIPILRFGADSPEDLIFQIDIPSGVNVIITSHSEVIKAKAITS